MGITELTTRLLLLFFPGIICFLIVETLTVHRERKTHEVLFFTFLFGMLSYLIYAIVLLPFGFGFSTERNCFCFKSDGPAFFRSLTDSSAKIDFWEIGWVALIAVLQSFLWSYCDKHKALHKLADKLKLSHKFGDPNVWSYALNVDDDLTWCVVRDPNKKLMYQGHIEAFSDVDDIAELLLSKVKVYNEETARELYSAEFMYISRKRDDLTLELQRNPNKGTANDKG